MGLRVDRSLGFGCENLASVVEKVDIGAAFLYFGFSTELRPPQRRSASCLAGTIEVAWGKALQTWERALIENLQS